MKVAIVHDYLKESGGAERVLQVLHEMFPEAPIYCAFYKPESTAAKEFVGADIRPSWANVLIRNWNLYSPLRFLAPFIWESFDFSSYDVVILSSSWFITKSIRIPKHVKVICYCHTPPRYLYGYATSMEWQRYWPVRIYGVLVAHFLRMYDFLAAQRVDQFIANSENVARRIEKFYRKDSVVIYPPVEVEKIKRSLLYKKTSSAEYFLVAGRIAGAKGVDLAMKAANVLNVKLKIVGEFAGIKFGKEDLEKLKSDNIEFLGRVSDEELYGLYAGAEAFLALGKDEDFGITPVEAMAAGTPVVAYKSGGYLETVVEGKTGVFFEEYNVESLVEAMKRVQGLRFKAQALRAQAEKFSKERFVEKFQELIKKHK
jgi:glycosyltransferase involved in cell wall biosynthesis